MADVVVNIAIDLVSYKSWLTTSYISTGVVGGDGSPLILNNELGPDQEDFFSSQIDDAAREVLKIFLSRQGDVEGTPFEKTETNIIYRFAEGLPVLPQASAIKNALTEDVKNALFTYITYLWLRVKKNTDGAAMVIEKYQKITKNIDNHLYKLHD